MFSRPKTRQRNDVIHHSSRNGATSSVVSGLSDFTIGFVFIAGVCIDQQNRSIIIRQTPWPALL